MKIDVTDFQALGHASVTAEGLTVITGPSDRGKSALLRAIEAGLFNRPGEGFVRLGRTSARVQLVLAGQDGARPTSIEWEKGAGTNRFTVDGIDYTRVGREAPPVLKALGFRDEVIGGRIRDDGKLEGGETMRPQVARQFDAIFLLDRPGSFIHEVVVKLSRLGVLQRANRACSGDLRTAKIALQAQQTRAEESREQATQLLPVVELRARVEALCAQARTVVAAIQVRESLVDLAAQRAKVLRLAEVRLPEVRATRAVAQQAGQRGILLATLQGLRAQQTQYRARIQALPKPERRDKKWWKQAEKSGALRQLVLTREDAQARLALLTNDAARREVDYETWGRALADLKKTLRTCPVCEKPFGPV